MGQTTYYEFNKPIGTDLVNPLVDQIPNWDIADNALHELNTRSVANASEVIALGVHAISRLNTDTKFIKWIATGNFTAGDTFTVDGNVVAASTPSGETLATDAYVTGAVVLACLNADDSAMTIYVTGTNVAKDSEKLGGELPAYYATQADMSNAQTDIGNIKALNGTTSIASIGDGTITGAISAIKSELPVSVTITGTTTSSGNLFTTYDADNYALMPVWAYETGYEPTMSLYPIARIVTGNKIGFKLLSDTISPTPVGNTNVTIKALVFNLSN